MKNNMKITLFWLLFLTACGSQKPTTTITTRLYQADQIFLEAGKPIQTKLGPYTPANDEIFYSAAKYEKLERELSEFR